MLHIWGITSTYIITHSPTDISIHSDVVPLLYVNAKWWHYTSQVNNLKSIWNALSVCYLISLTIITVCSSVWWSDGQSTIRPCDMNYKTMRFNWKIIHIYIISGHSTAAGSNFGLNVVYDNNFQCISLFMISCCLWSDGCCRDWMIGWYGCVDNGGCKLLYKGIRKLFYANLISSPADRTDTFLKF